MRQRTIVGYGLPPRLGEALQALARERGVWLREVQHVRSCRSALRPAGAAVLVLKLGRDLERELALLEETSRLFPDVQAVVVGDADHPALAGLAWDLGAACVLFPPQPLERLPELVFGLLGTEQP